MAKENEKTLLELLKARPHCELYTVMARKPTPHQGADVRKLVEGRIIAMLVLMMKHAVGGSLVRWIMNYYYY